MINHDHTARRGFTLTELAVSVGVMAVVGAFAVSSHRSTQHYYMVERAVARMATDLTASRMRAISECCAVTVTFDVSAKSYTIAGDANTNGVIEADERRQEVLAPEITLTMGAGCTQGVFSARGNFNASAPFWLIKLGVEAGDERLIYVLPNGQVRCMKDEMQPNVSMAYGI